MTALIGLAAGVCAPSTVHGVRTPFLSPAYADWQPDQTGKTVDLDLANADLSVVVAMIERQTGVEIVVQQGDHPYGRVTASLTGKPLADALDYIALSANASVTRSADGVYIFKPAADIAPVPIAQPSEGDYHYYKITLQHAVPKDVLYILGWDRDIRPSRPDSEAPAGPPTGISSVSNPSILLTGQGDTTPAVPAARGTVGDQAANRSVDESGDGDQEHQFPGVTTTTGGFNNGGFNNGGFNGAGGFTNGGFNGAGGFNGNNGAAAGPLATGGLPEGVDHIYALQGDNSLLIRATPEGYQRVREVIRDIDIAPRQVQIKIEFVTATINDVDAFGIDYQLVPNPGITAVAPTIAPTSPTATVNYAAGNLVAAMEAQLTHGHSKVVESYIVTTTNNMPTNINFSTEIPYTTTTTVVPNGGQAVTNAQQNFLTVTSSFNVSPRINSDDSVSMLLAPTVTNINPAPAGSVPTTSQQSLSTYRTVQSGETMVLGGLINKDEENSITKVPILGDLPIIGGMFRTRNKTVDDSELLIFVTPTIIVDSNSTSSSAEASPAAGEALGAVSP